MALSYTFSVPRVTPIGQYHRVTVPDLHNLDRPGDPRLPVKTASVLVPYGQRVEDITVECTERHVLPGSYHVELGPNAYPLSYTGPITPASPNPQIYAQTALFPPTLDTDLVDQVWRGYRMAFFSLYPVQYRPQVGTLTYCTEMQVRVTLASSMSTASQRLRDRPQQWRSDREEVRTMVDNPNVVASYPAPTEIDPHTAVPLLDASDAFDYVIITSEALMNATGPYRFQDLSVEKASRGVTTLITTTEWISASYAGVRPDGDVDLQTKIRQFIDDAYTTWGTTYVLLGGDGDGSGGSADAIVPHRGFYNEGGGSYEDYDIPADMYYACLDGTFDDDADGIYGEPTDGPDGGEVDLWAEVYVGRAPVDSEAELSDFVRKTLAYQTTDDNYLQDVLMVGEDLGWDEPWGGDRKDDIKEGGNIYGYTTVGFEDSDHADFFDTQTLYDRDGVWDKSELIGMMNDSVHLINHLGHANTIYVMKMGNGDVDALTNEDYFIAYSQGCYAGAFDNRGTTPGSYFTSDSISEHFVTGDHGAVAVVSNSRYGWGDGGNAHGGSSQYYDRQFWDAVLEEGIVDLGPANQDSKEDTYTVVSPSGFHWVLRWVYYELNLFGDPELAIKTATAPIIYKQHAVDDDTMGQSNGNANGQVDAGETVELSVALLNAGSTELADVTATLATTDSHVTITEAMASYGTLPPSTVVTSTTPYVLSVDPGCPDDHEITFGLTITGSVDAGVTETWTHTFQVGVENNPHLALMPEAYDEELISTATLTRLLEINNVGTAPLVYTITEPSLVIDETILLVDDDTGGTYDARPYYEAALDVLGIAYDVFDTGGEDGPSTATMDAYPAVIWFSGDTYGGTAGPNSADETNLEDYLDHGGSLFLTSQDYLWDMGGVTLFNQTYLGLMQAVQDVGYTSVTGVSGDPVGAYFGTQALLYPGNNYSDSLTPDTTASSAFSGQGGDYAGLTKADTYRTVFFAFPWEALPNADTEAGRMVLQSVLTWLISDTDVPWLSLDPMNETVESGATGTVELTFDATQVVAPEMYEAWFWVLSNDPDQNLVQVPVTMTVSAAPWLTLSKQTHTTMVQPGDLLTYTLTVTNVGDAAVSGLVVTDTLPLHTTFVSADQGGTEVGGVVRWDAMDLPLGDDRTFQMVVQVAQALPNETVITNADYGATCDQGMGADGPAVETGVEAPELVVNKQGPRTAEAGEMITYTLTVSNAGAIAANDLVITDTLPANVTFISGSQGGREVDGVVTWDGLSLLAGDWLTRELIVQMDPHLPNGTIITNAKYGASCGQCMSGQGAPVKTAVQAPKLAVSKRGPAVALVEDLITYTLVVTNVGHMEAENVILTDTLPTGAVYAQGGTLEGRQVRWDVGDIAPGAGETSTLTVRVSQTLTNTDYGARTAGGYVVKGVHPVRTDVFERVTAQFSAFPREGEAPLSTTFTNVSAGDYVSCAWAFGDGQRSTLCDPTHVYAAAGHYTVTLTVEGPGGLDEEVKQAYISVTEKHKVFLPLLLRN
jgi:uncharacterized repeat protein (TIGR01451 family)